MTRQIKICGLSTPQAVATALNAGADMIGLVFYPPSPRNISIERGVELAQPARGKSAVVALTVDADDDLIKEIAQKLHPDFFQLHGSETPDRVGEIKAMTGIPVIKAIKVRTIDDMDTLADYESVADLVLFDAKAPADLENPLPGGNGVSFDWSLLADTNPPPKYMLSGGLDRSNVASAIAMTNAPMLDVSSGVESTPGEKSLAEIEKFIEAARAAG